MKVLIGCEMSAIVKKAFLSQDHNAFSVDLKPSLMPDRHFQKDLFEVINGENWDLLICFPPCTFLAKCQIAQMLADKARMREALKAVQFVKNILASQVNMIAVENPVGILSTIYRKPDQIIQPWQFGNPHSKEICLWLKNLPPLITGAKHWKRQPVSNHVNGRMSQALKSEIKSMFFPEVAEAMAIQWGSLKN